MLFRSFSETLRKAIIIKNYPTDSTVYRKIPTEKIYDKRNQEKLSLILNSINRQLSTRSHSGGYTILDDAPTIEHIMPQNLNEQWEKELGEHWEQTYKDFLHTLGNLTIVTRSWNSELSNLPFKEKKEKLSNHALCINNEYFKQEIARWNAETIQQRTNFLVKIILELWPELGTPPALTKSIGRKPQKLLIMGQDFKVSTWRDVAFLTAKVISELVDDFDHKIAEQMPAYFDHEKFQQACQQLPNGWWIYLNLSAETVKKICRLMLSYAEIPESEWQIEEI